MNDDARKSVDFEATQSWENLSEEVLLCKRETFQVAESKIEGIMKLEDYQNI